MLHGLTLPSKLYMREIISKLLIECATDEVLTLQTLKFIAGYFLMLRFRNIHVLRLVLNYDICSSIQSIASLTA
jgi:hypothetical protein